MDPVQPAQPQGPSPFDYQMARGKSKGPSAAPRQLGKNPFMPAGPPSMPAPAPAGAPSVAPISVKTNPLGKGFGKFTPSPGTAWGGGGTMSNAIANAGPSVAKVAEQAAPVVAGAAAPGLAAKVADGIGGAYRTATSIPGQLASGIGQGIAHYGPSMAKASIVPLAASVMADPEGAFRTMTGAPQRPSVAPQANGAGFIHNFGRILKGEVSPGELADSIQHNVPVISDMVKGAQNAGEAFAHYYNHGGIPAFVGDVGKVAHRVGSIMTGTGDPGLNQQERQIQQQQQAQQQHEQNASIAPHQGGDSPAVLAPGAKAAPPMPGQQPGGQAAQGQATGRLFARGRDPLYDELYEAARRHAENARYGITEDLGMVGPALDRLAGYTHSRAETTTSRAHVDAANPISQYRNPFGVKVLAAQQGLNPEQEGGLSAAAGLGQPEGADQARAYYQSLDPSLRPKNGEDFNPADLLKHVATSPMYSGKQMLQKKIAELFAPQEEYERASTPGYVDSALNWFGMSRGVRRANEARRYYNSVYGNGR